MSITPLYRDAASYRCPSEETLFLLLDEPDESREKRLFLRHAGACSSCLQRWETLQRWVQRGAALPEHRPDPSIRARVLDAAYRESEGERAGGGSSVLAWTLREIPGWRWAWAALFLVLSWGIYAQWRSTETAIFQADSLDYELLSLEEELDGLQADLGLESDYWMDEKA